MWLLDQSARLGDLQDPRACEWALEEVLNPGGSQDELRSREGMLGIFCAQCGLLLVGDGQAGSAAA